MDTTAINERYSKLADDTCCLSCGSALTFAEPKEGEVCIDLGCGRGNDVIRMAQSVGEKGLAYGLDISDGMIDKAKRNAEKLGVTNVQFIKSELESLKIPTGIADLLISNCTLNHASDKTAVWNEIFRVLKKGGRFVVSDIYSIEDVPEEYKNDPEAVSECWAGSIRKDVYIDTIIKAGFKNITIIEDSAPYPKGKIEVASFTVAGEKSSCCC